VTAGPVRRGLLRAAQFGRLPPVGATLTLVAVGLAAGSAGGDPAVRRAAAVALAAVLFHIGVYVCNDIVDVKIDRTDPRRAHLPLAAGLVPVRLAVLVVAVALLSGAAVLWAATTDPAVLGCYALATAGLLGYDLLGKRTPVPPVLDLVQGAGWGFLVLLAAASAGSVGAAAGWLAGSAGLYVALVNGVIAGLRDLPNDRRHGARTTAVLFMARPAAVPARPGVPARRLPAGFQAYALALHLLAAAACLAGVGTLAGLDPAGRRPALVLSAAGELVCLLLLASGLRRYDGARGGWRTGFGYIVLALWSLATPVLARFGGVALGLVSAVLLVPWLGSRVVQSLWRAGPDPSAAAT